MDKTKLPRVNKCLEFDTPEEYEEVKAEAEIEFARLVELGYPSVQLIISEHTYSEGLWIEAGQKPNKRHKLDHLLKTHP